MKTLKREIAGILVIKVILLTLLWQYCLKPMEQKKLNVNLKHWFLDKGYTQQ